MPALCGLTRAALRGVTALATAGVALATRPPSPLRCAELVLGTAMRVNDALLNWANTALGDIENRAPEVLTRGALGTMTT